ANVRPTIETSTTAIARRQSHRRGAAVERKISCGTTADRRRSPRIAVTSAGVAISKVSLDRAARMRSFIGAPRLRVQGRKRTASFGHIDGHAKQYRRQFVVQFELGPN